MFMPYASNKGADQPAHPRRLISAFVVRCLDSLILLLAIAEISRLLLVSVVEQAGLSLTWLQTPKIGSLVTRLNSSNKPCRKTNAHKPPLINTNEFSHLNKLIITRPNKHINKDYHH